MVVYVDDLILVTKTTDMMNNIKVFLSEKFEIVDKGKVHYCLGLQIERDSDRGRMKIGQSQHIKNLLRQCEMTECKPYYTPLDAGQKLVKCDKAECVKIEAEEYQSMVGSLMYLAISTRPDIAHSVSKLSQFNVAPHAKHLVAIKHLLRYLNATMDLKIVYAATEAKRLSVYVDADWGANLDNRKSYTGYTFLVAGGAVSWESRGQKSVALSSTEAEYMALSHAGKEAVYLYNISVELGFPEMVSGGITLSNDNLGAQQLVKNPVYHSRSKHIDIRYHYMCARYTGEESSTSNTFRPRT